MRFVAVIFIALWCTACQHGQHSQFAPPGSSARDPSVDHNRWLSTSDFEGVTYDFAISDALLRQTSSWRAEKDPLPLTPSKAKSLAIDEAHRLRPDVGSWWVDEVELHWVVEDSWYYLITLSRRDIAITGMPFFLKVPVLMDGVAVHPVSIKR